MKIKLDKTFVRLGDYILHNYNHLTIFSSYLSTENDPITVSDLEYYIENNIKISNPLRTDENPSLGFYYNKHDKLIMHDFANEVYRGDLFDLVALVLDRNSNVSDDFTEICKHIIANVEKGEYDIVPKILLTRTKIITIITREWSNYDRYYWNLGGVNITKQKEIYPVLHAFSDNDRIFTHLSDRNPCYAYYKGRSLKEKQIIYKLYIPNTKGRSKFYSNLNIKIDLRGFSGGKLMIITKSDKDRLVLKSSIERLAHNTLLFRGGDQAQIVHSSNVSSESSYLNRATIEYILSLYDNILLNLDFDRTGIFAAYYYYKVYNIDTIFIGNSYEYNKIPNKEIIRLFEKIKLDSPENNILFKRDFINYIESNIGRSPLKDFYDYSKHNGKKQLDKLILNKITEQWKKIGNSKLIQ